jgi:hypothetical protein
MAIGQQVRIINVGTGVFKRVAETGYDGTSASAADVREGSCVTNAPREYGGAELYER